MKAESPSIPTRASLLARLKDWDDQKSWRDFFDTYWQLIFAVARKNGLTPTEAEDLVQDVFVELAEKMKSFKYDPAIGTFKGWLCTRTRRRVIDRHRKRARQPDTPNFHASEEESTEAAVERLPAADDQSWEDAWEADWQRNLLETAAERAKRKVSARQFQIFDLHVLQDKPAAEVATCLGISSAQVHLAKFRVRAVVQSELRRLEKELI